MSAVVWDDRTARMWEIAENLDRADLDVIERARQTAEWIHLYEEGERRRREEGVSEHFVQKPQGGRPESGVAAAARALPLPGDTEEARRNTARRAMKVAGSSERVLAEAK